MGEEGRRDELVVCNQRANSTIRKEKAMTEQLSTTPMPLLCDPRRGNG
jgi:hypothetical protein